MSNVILGATISLDGFLNDRTGSVEPLYPDFEAMQASDLMRESIRSTGAVVMGRNTFAMSGDPDWYAGNYEFQVPVFVLTHLPPARHPKEGGGLTFTFVTDGLESALRQARAAAGDKDLTVIAGASTARQVLEAGLADLLDVDVMPVLLGGGLRLFEALPHAIQLERLRGVAMPAGRTHLRFRVVK
jgi:dihydrofolate reductase